VRDAFVRTNRRAIVMMFVCLSGMGVHCHHTVHYSTDLSLRFESPMFWAPWHYSMSTYARPSLQFQLEERYGMDLQTRCDISRMVEDRGYLQPLLRYHA